jgi:hypothetical protein
MMLRTAKIAFVATSVLLASLGTGCSSTGDELGTTNDQLEGGGADLAIARFAPHLKSLERILDSHKSLEKIAEDLLDSNARTAAFSLQALCRVYADADPDFKKIRDDLKGLEDAIGTYDKWYNVLRAAEEKGKGRDTLDRLEKKEKKALEDFKKLLRDRDWVPADGTSRVEKIQKLLEKFDWKSRKTDRERVLGSMIDELKDIDQNDYDMKKLEYGKGIHELRRDIRWVLIEQRSLHGLITLKKSCPIQRYESLSGDDFAALHSAEPNACEVSAVSNST